MNPQLWQTVVSLGVVVLAAAWCVRQFWRTWANPSPSTPCGGCSGCPNNAEPLPDSQSNGFVSLATLEETAAHQLNKPVQPIPR